MVPRAVLMKSGLVSINTARQNISKTAVLVNTTRQVNIHVSNGLGLQIKLIQMVKIHTDRNVADLLTKAFDVILLVILNTAELLLLVILNTVRKAKKSVKLMIEKLFRMELELMLVTQSQNYQWGSTVAKKIIITESTVSRDLQLEDTEGVDCLPNSTIFEQLTLMGSKTTTWNKFNSTMTSVIICLGTNQKFNFSKYIFESMIRNLDNLSELGEGSANRTDPHHTPTIIQSLTQPQKTQKPRKPKRKDTQVPQPSDPSKNVTDEGIHKELGDSLVRAATTHSSLEAGQDSGKITKTRSKETPNESSSLGTTSGGGPKCQETIRDTTARTRFESVSKHSNDSLLAKGNTIRSDEDRFKLDELMTLCTTLQNRVLDLEKTKTTQQNEIASLKRRVKKLEKKSRSRTHKLKRLYKVGLTARVESSGDEESLGEDASKQGRINAIDADEEITLLSVQDDVDKEMFDVDALNALEALKTSNPKVKGIVFQDPELVEGKEKRAGTELMQENTKKQKVEDDKEIAELKHLMKIIPDEEEVAINVIPLAVKSPSIVGWKIYKEGRKSYCQIMRADEKSQMYMFFSQNLKKFDREDLEDFYKLVKAKFESTKPVEDLDLLLWGDLKTMFEPHVKDAVWMNQQAYKVLDWKLYESCGVHSLRMQHRQIYMLVEKKYPLVPLTLSMMLEKKLNIDYKSKMAYQLLKLIIKQFKK
ncbi:hypothetical protein Tco_1383580 [Tanacetum coccineum]